MKPSRLQTAILGLSAALVVTPAVFSQRARPSVPSQQPVLGSAPACAGALRDTADPTSCLEGASTPELGKLYPLSNELFVSPTGNVGIGTTAPSQRLDVLSGIRVSREPGVARAQLRESTDTRFGLLETLARGASGVPQVSNLISSSSVDHRAGAMATVNGVNFLVSLTTPALGANAGYVSVRNQNVEVAGINGANGSVFGTSKSFVQPHPTDAEKEIQYVSLEGPEHGIYYRGTARLAGGSVVIEAPESFPLVARADGLTVSLTPLGPSRGLYVAAKSAARIEVRENEGGSGEVEFDYLVMGKRSALPEHVAITENRHFAPAPGTLVPEGALPASYRELMVQNGTLTPDGRVNEHTALKQGWRRSAGQWVGSKADAADVERD